MRPKFFHVSSLLVSHVLEKLDHLLHAAEVIQDLSLNVVKVELKLILVGAMEGDSHELPGLLSHVEHVAQVCHSTCDLTRKGPFDEYK